MEMESTNVPVRRRPVVTTRGAMETRASFTATCRYCKTVVLTAPQILTAELAKLNKHLNDHHPGGLDKEDQARGLSAVVQYFVVERYPAPNVEHSPRHLSSAAGV
jgi:hypothetical protein